MTVVSTMIPIEVAKIENNDKKEIKPLLDFVAINLVAMRLDILSDIFYRLELVPGAGVEPARNIIPRDFKSLASTNFATQALY